MRGEDGVLVKGKFTPIRSGHLPPQRQVHSLYGLPTTVSGQGETMMTGALSGNQPARAVGVANRDRTVISNPGGRDGQRGQGARPKKKKTERELRREKWLKDACWLIFSCGLCGDWDVGR